MDVKKFYETLAAIIAAKEGATVKVKSIKKAAGEADTCGNAKRHLEHIAV